MGAAPFVTVVTQHATIAVSTAGAWLFAVWTLRAVRLLRRRD